LIFVKTGAASMSESLAMPARAASSWPSHRTPGRRFAVVAALVLVTLGAVPVLALFRLDALLSRDCVTERSVDGDAGGNLVWRIETLRCGGGPLVENVLVAPRGKSFALVASSTGQPRPVAVRREADGTTRLVLEGDKGREASELLLALKATGRPAKPLVLKDGRPKP
jgi:hypothetical protein